jgi:HEAT repeat protein
MALVKSNRAAAAAAPPAPQPGCGLEELRARLQEDDAAVRRFAARALASVAGGGEPLCDRLEDEADESVRLAILEGLREHRSAAVVERLVDLLRSEDASLRNHVIEVLSEWPEVVAQRIDALLGDADSDVRIFAVNILALLPHPEVPAWLRRVLEEESHVNVCAAAVDVLTDVGDEEAVPALLALKRRFADEPFMTFAVDMAVRRIGGS